MFDIIWSQNATNVLAMLCLDHPSDWSVINTAEEDITSKLQVRPLKHSQEISEGLRRIISWPLIVYFSIDGNQIEIDAVGWID